MNYSTFILFCACLAFSAFNMYMNTKAGRSAALKAFTFWNLFLGLIAAFYLLLEAIVQHAHP